MNAQYWITLGAALVLSGCASISPLTPGLITRYEDYGLSGTTEAYSDCVLQDNSSWRALDACMAGKGYKLRKTTTEPNPAPVRSGVWRGGPKP